VAFVEFEVRANGLLVEASIGLSAARLEQYYKLGREVPPAVNVTLMVDTGADTTMLGEQIFRTLDLQPTGQARIHTSTSGVQGEPCDTYDVSLAIKNRANEAIWTVQPIEVLARPLIGQSIDGMIGRDLLNQCVLEYDGPRKVFRIHSPRR